MQSGIYRHEPRKVRKNVQADENEHPGFMRVASLDRLCAGGARSCAHPADRDACAYRVTVNAHLHENKGSRRVRRNDCAKTGRREKEVIARVIGHELTHKITLEITDSLNSWLAEGLAVYFGSIPFREGNVLQMGWYTAEELAQPISWLEETTLIELTDEKTIGLYNAASSMVVEFIVDTYGLDKIHALLSELSKYPSAYHSLLQKLPFLTDSLEVDDLDANVKLIEDNGGFIVDPPLDLPGARASACSTSRRG